MTNASGVTRQYYSQRNGGGKLNLDRLKVLFCSAYKLWRKDGYFDEAFGYYCVDAGSVAGWLGTREDVGDRMLLCLHKEELWPIEECIPTYSEEDLFDVVEWLYDHISCPANGTYHTWDDCGMHWSDFDREDGRAQYRARINEMLSIYDKGYTLSLEGEILEIGMPGTAKLLSVDVPSSDPRIAGPIQRAIPKFTRYRSPLGERRDAVRELVDVLEYLRPRLKEALTRKDEAALFDIANNFHIRHSNELQKTDYDESIWLSWMFYFYLSTIHAALRLLEKDTSKVAEPIPAG